MNTIDIEEITRQFIVHPVWRRLLDHPQENRFNCLELVEALQAADFAVRRSHQFAGMIPLFLVPYAIFFHFLSLLNYLKFQRPNPEKPQP